MQRILAIDDDPAVTTVLKRGLAYEGFTVETASSGEEGLERARQSPPDLVALDRMMPGIDGLEVLRRLRAGLAAPARGQPAARAALCRPHARHRYASCPAWRPRDRSDHD